MYDYPSTISDLKPIKTDISSTIYVITPSMLNTTNLQCKPSQVAYVCHLMRYTGHHMHNLEQPLLFMTSHALYLFHHTHYIWHLINSVWCYIHYVCYITQWPIYGNNHYMFKIYSHDMSSGTVLWPHTNCVPSQQLCLTLHSMYFFTLHTMYRFFWKEVNVCHHSLYMCDTICTTYDITSTLYDITPLYLWRQVHYI